MKSSIKILRSFATVYGIALLINITALSNGAVWAQDNSADNMPLGRQAVAIVDDPQVRLALFAAADDRDVLRVRINAVFHEFGHRLQWI